MDKIVLITGTSSGFGRLTAQTLAKAGHKVYASMRDINQKNQESAKELEEWSRTYRLMLKVIELDVTNIKSVESAVNEILVEDGRIDVLVNNAGSGCLGITEDFTSEIVRRQFETNVFGVFDLTKTVIPYMKKAKSGLIITISSGLGRIVVPLISVYSACKFAVEALAEGWRYELNPIGIDSIIVEPGMYPTTKFLENASYYSPEPSGKISEYGVLKNFMENYQTTIKESIKNGNANNPQDVANTIECLINLPYGVRPLRTVVDKMSAAMIRNLNKTTDEIEFNMLQVYDLA